MRRVVINGKFQSQKSTGVQRVANAFATHLVELERQADPAVRGLQFSVATPAKTQSVFPNLSPRPSKMTGVAWEQIELPALAGKDVLLNLCNVGPISRHGDIVMIHDAQAYISPQSYSVAFRTWYKSILPILARRASRVLTVSEYARQCLAEVKVAPYEKIDVIHNGVDHILEIYPDTSILTSLGLEERPYIAALGSVQHHKNIKVVAAAANLMKNKDAAIVLIGSATAEDYEAAGISLSPNTVLAGRLSDAQMRAVMEHAHAFAFPSLTEGFGLPPLEAMRLNVPAIVAPCGALPELCDGAALMVDPTSPEAWADAFDLLLSDRNERSRLSQLGKKKATIFTWASATHKLAGILQQYA
jgi:glycosyltransferase involved in cell wall biosynthesis